MASCPIRDGNQTFDFNNQFAVDNPLKAIRPYIGAKNAGPDDPGLYLSDGSAFQEGRLYPHSHEFHRHAHQPDGAEQGHEQDAESGPDGDRPGELLPDERFLVRTGRRRAISYTQWHTFTSSSANEWSGIKREHYNNLHEEGGILISCDGHAEYKQNRKTSSLDFGLVDSKGADSPWQPTEAHSRAAYFYQMMGKPLRARI